jgi:RNA polymerase-binding transcription factor DksA
MMMMRDDRIHDAEDLCGAFDYASLETDIQAQRMVALEERRLDAAIEELLKLENQMRCAADVSRTRRVVVAIVQLCYEARAWKTLNDQIRLLSQRQPQLQQVL